MSAAAASIGPRWPGARAEGDRRLRGMSVALAAACLAAYALFLTVGPGVGSCILVAAVAVSLFAFPVLMYRWPVHFIVVLGLLGALAIVSMYGLIIDWDARSIWFYHARFIFAGAGPTELLGPDRPLFHSQYPKMLPLVAASVARAAGFWNEALPKLAVPILFAAPLMCIVGTWPNRATRLLVLCAIIVIGGRYIWNGYVDALLATYAVAALGAGLRYLDSRERLDGYAAALLAAMLPTLKTEGLLAFGAIGIALLLRMLAEGGPREAMASLWRIALPLAAGLAAALGWYLYVRFLSDVPADVFKGDPFGRILGRLGDGTSLAEIWRAMFVDRFRGVWAVAALAMVLLGGRDVRRGAVPFFLAGAISVAGLTVVYLMTPHGLTWHLATSVERTMMLPLLLFAAAVIPFRPAGRHPEHDTSSNEER